MKNIVVLIFFCIGFYTNSFAKSFFNMSDTSIVVDVDVVPQFKGGVRSWNNFLVQNLNVSRLANAMDSTAYVTYGAKQTAMLEFTVCEDGRICEVIVVNKDKISPELEKEVLRVMNRSPKWVPAMKDGKVVRTRFKQSIRAILE